MSHSEDSIVVTGGRGALAAYIPNAVGVDREDFDITQCAQTQAWIEEKKPTVIIHLAAYTDVAGCEANSGDAYMTNAIGAYHVALAARRVGARMVYVSTNAVFDGEGSEPFGRDMVPQPQGVYGHSKYAGELLVQGVLPDALIVRTSWVFGGGPEKDKRFVGKIIAQLEKDEITAVSDVMGTPTYAKDLGETLLQLVAKKEQGIFHVVNGGRASRFDMATHIVKASGSSARVVPASRTLFGAHIPSNEMLLSDAPLRPWQDALDEYIREWYHL